MFCKIEEDPANDYSLIGSCLEIYNENINDLLGGPKSSAGLELWDDVDQGLMIPNLVKIDINNIKTVTIPLTKGH